MKNLFDQWCLGRGAAVCEGAMGLYDGVGGTDQASVWQVADALELPVLLVVRTGGAGLTLAAQIRGLQSFRENSRLRGILLNQCRPELCRHLAPMLERETGLPVLDACPGRSGRRSRAATWGCTPPVKSRICGRGSDCWPTRWRGMWIWIGCWNCSAGRIGREIPRPRCPDMEPPLQWPGTRRFALPMPRRWRPWPGLARGCCFSAPSGTGPSRRGAAWTVSAGGIPGAACRGPGTKQRHAGADPRCGGEWHAHSGGVRRLFISGTGSAGRSGTSVADGRLAAWGGVPHREAGALWLCRAHSRGGEPALPPGRAGAGP